MARFDTKLQKHIEKLIQKGTLNTTLVTMMGQGRYADTAEMLNAYRYAINADDDKAADRLKQFDLLHDVYGRVENDTRVIFLAIALPHISDNEMFADHPFNVAMRKNLTDISRERALETLERLWNGMHKDGFLHVHDVLLVSQNNRQRKTDPQFTEDSLADQILVYPGLELAVLQVPRGSTGNHYHNTDLPNLRVLVSNADADSKSDFLILTAKGQFTNLESYMRASLADEHGSYGHGAYNYFTNDDRCPATAVNVIATIHAFLRVPHNFKAPAQARLRDQVKSIKMSALSPIHMHRYLRMQEWSPWMAAVCRAYELGGRGMEDEITVKDAAKTLVQYGFTGAVSSLRNMVRGRGEAVFQEGFVEGLDALRNDMSDLLQSASDNTIESALHKYERERGFHPDVMLYPVQERRRLAFQGLSDIALGHVTSGTMLMALADGDQSTDLGSAIINTAELMIQAGDVSNAMRVADHYQLVGGGFKKYGDLVEENMRRAGYYVPPKGRFKQSDLGFKVVVSAQGDFMLRTDNMIRFETPEQMIDNNNPVDAYYAHKALSVVNYPQTLQDKKDAQINALADFLKKKVLEKDMRDSLASVPAEMRDDMVAMMHQGIHITGALLVEDGEDPEDVKKQVSIVYGAFKDATGATARPAMGRVIKALSRVGRIFGGKAPKQER